MSVLQQGHTTSRGRNLMAAGGPVEIVIGLVAALATIWWMGNNAYLGDLVLLISVYALIALGMYVPFIMAGALSLAYNAYFAMGAYSVAILANHSTWPILVAVPIGIALAAFSAVALGLVTRRLSGFYLAVATLLFGVAFQRWIVDADTLTGGAAGLGNIPRPEVFGWTVERVHILIAGVLLVWLMACILSRLRRSLFGIVVRFQREVPVAAEASGVPTVRLKIVTLAIGAALAALAGSLFALVNQFILSESFSLQVVFLALYMPLLGGMASPWGAVVGAAIVVALTQGLTFFQSTGSLMFAVAIMAVLLFAPGGLLSFVARVVRLAVQGRGQQGGDRA